MLGRGERIRVESFRVHVGDFPGFGDDFAFDIAGLPHREQGNQVDRVVRGLPEGDLATARLKARKAPVGFVADQDRV